MTTPNPSIDNVVERRLQLKRDDYINTFLESVKLEVSGTNKIELLQIALKFLPYCGITLQDVANELGTRAVRLSHFRQGDNLEFLSEEECNAILKAIENLVKQDKTPEY